MIDDRDDDVAETPSAAQSGAEPADAGSSQVGVDNGQAANANNAQTDAPEDDHSRRPNEQVPPESGPVGGEQDLTDDSNAPDPDDASSPGKDDRPLESGSGHTVRHPPGPSAGTSGDKRGEPPEAPVAEALPKGGSEEPKDPPSDTPKPGADREARYENDQNDRIDFSGGARADREEKLGDALHIILGPELTEVFKEQFRTGTGQIEAGLNVVYAPLPFALGWIKEQLASGDDTYTVTVGSLERTRRAQASSVAEEKLSAIAKRYSDQQAVVVVLSQAARKTFFDINRDLSGLQELCLSSDLRMILVLSQRHQQDAPWSKAQQEFIDRVIRTPPDPVALFTHLLKHMDLETTTEIESDFLDFEIIEAALQAQRQNLRGEFLDCIEQLQKNGRINELRAPFFTYAVEKKTLDPMVAAAMYLGAHFSGTRSSLFVHMLEILRFGAVACWGDPDPDLSSTGEWVPRPWRESRHDEACKLIGLRMMAPRDEKGVRGALEAQFLSGSARDLYRRMFAQDAAKLNELLFHTVTAQIQPLNFGDHLILPFSELVAYRIRDEYGERPEARDVVVELVDIIELHRRDLDQAQAEFRKQLESMSVPTDLLDLLDKHARAFRAARQTERAEKSTETARLVCPHFVGAVLNLVYANDPEQQIRAVEELAHRHHVGRVQDDSERGAFWRQVVVGAALRVDPQGAFDLLDRLFRESSTVTYLLLEDVVPATINGLRFEPDKLYLALISAHHWVLAADKDERHWRFSVYLSILTVWMHTVASPMPKELRTAITGEELSESFARLLLDRQFAKALTNLNALRLYLAEEAGAEPTDLEAVRDAGTLTYRLGVALLRMMFGLSGGRQLRAFAAKVDGPAEPVVDFYDKDRWLSRDARHRLGRLDEDRRLDELDRFGAWIETSMGYLGTALIATECDLGEADPGERAKKAIIASGERGIAKRALCKAPRWWRENFKDAFASGNQSEAHKLAIQRRDAIVRRLSEAASNAA